MGRRPSGVGFSIAALEADFRRRIKAIKKLAKQRSSLMSQLAAVDAKIAAAGGGGAVRAAATGGGGRGGNADGLAESLQKVLKGKTMGVAEAAAAVQEAGYRTKAANFRTIVNACLLKHRSMFKKVARGKYTAA